MFRSAAWTGANAKLCSTDTSRWTVHQALTAPRCHEGTERAITFIDTPDHVDRGNETHAHPDAYRSELRTGLREISNLLTADS